MSKMCGVGWGAWHGRGVQSSVCGSRQEAGVAGLHGQRTHAATAPVHGQRGTSAPLSSCPSTYPFCLLDPKLPRVGRTSHHHLILLLCYQIYFSACNRGFCYVRMHVCVNSVSFS